MPIIVKSKANQSSNDVIRQFKKVVASTDIVQKIKDRRFFTKPSQERAVKKEELKKQKKRARTQKRMKNPPTRKVVARPRSFSQTGSF